MTDHMSAIKCPNCRRSDSFLYLEKVESTRGVRVAGGKLVVSRDCNVDTAYLAGNPTRDCPEFQCEACGYTWPVPDWVMDNFTVESPRLCPHGKEQSNGCGECATNAVLTYADAARRRERAEAKYGKIPIPEQPGRACFGPIQGTHEEYQRKAIPVPAGPGRLALPPQEPARTVVPIPVHDGRFIVPEGTPVDIAIAAVRDPPPVDGCNCVSCRSRRADQKPLRSLREMAKQNFLTFPLGYKGKP